ncbi:MAG: glutathione S-transferase family protein [Bauldia sp.]|nr:glutathione S-transferase family protein [Bauldia sp.]
MKLYVHPFSQHSRRVLMLCHELGLEFEAVHVALESGEQKSEDYLRTSTTGLVPVLEDGGFTLPESHAIMRYLAAKAGDRTFYPTEPEKRARVDMWLDWNHTRLNPPIQTLVIETMMKRGSGDEGVAMKSRKSAEAELAILERGLQGPAALGGAPTLADLSIASTIALYEMVGGDLAPYPTVSRWYEGLKKRKSFVATAPVAA